MSDPSTNYYMAGIEYRVTRTTCRLSGLDRSMGARRERLFFLVFTSIFENDSEVK
jgi:hypothetical protein